MRWFLYGSQKRTFFIEYLEITNKNILGEISGSNSNQYEVAVSWRHCLFVEEGLCAPFEAESYAGSSVAADMFYHAGQVKA